MNVKKYMIQNQNVSHGTHKEYQTRTPYQKIEITLLLKHMQISKKIQKFLCTKTPPFIYCVFLTISNGTLMLLVCSSFASVC